MPRNRRPQPKAEKRAALVTAARALFLHDGYDATTMSRIARAADVTPNTIYWYFRDKDDLLINVLDDVTGEMLDDYARVVRQPLSEQFAWIVERLREVSGLVSTVHTRIKTSPALDEWHSQFHATFEEFFEQQLPAPLPADARDAELNIVAYALEGLITHELDAIASQRICDALADRLVAAAVAA
jgi:AcrR family transcriptional regulator